MLDRKFERVDIRRKLVIRKGAELGAVNSAGVETVISTANLGALSVTAGAATASKAMVLDASKGISGITSLSATTLRATGTLGYATGAGGTITQATSKATAFTLSKASGAITTAADALGAATIVSPVWTNTTIAATDVVVINHLSGGTVGAYTFNVQCAAGSATLNIRNATAGSLSEALVLSFVVIKGVTA